jgi:hypothetical protein
MNINRLRNKRRSITDFSDDGRGIAFTLLSVIIGGWPTVAADPAERKDVKWFLDLIAPDTRRESSVSVCHNRTR